MDATLTGTTAAQLLFLKQVIPTSVPNPTVCSSTLPLNLVLAFDRSTALVTEELTEPLTPLRVAPSPAVIACDAPVASVVELDV